VEGGAECVSVTAGETEWLWGFVELQQVVCGGGAECVSVTAGETEWLWGFVELQQVGLFLRV
jgi:hypothetical protein